MLITEDTKGFPAAALHRRELTVKRPDAYLCEVFEAFPDDMIALVREMAADKVRPPMTTDDVLDALERAGATRFARAARKRLTEGQ